MRVGEHETVSMRPKDGDVDLISEPAARGKMLAD
jgi:hypothetical protein